MRIVLEQDCTTARVTGRVNERVLQLIDRTLTFVEPSAYFSPAFKLKQWDGKRYLFSMKSQTFPAGLADRVVEALDHDGLDDVDVVDTRPSLPWGDEPPNVPFTLHDRARGHITLEGDQREALGEWLAVGRGCIEMPTAAGKTIMMAAALKIIDGRALVIVDRRGLMQQTTDVLADKLQERIALYGAGYRGDGRARITVATVQSLWHHREQLKRDFFPYVHTLIVDEAHRIGPRQYYRTLAVIPAPVRLGLSATIAEAPRRMMVEAYLGPIVASRDLHEMVSAGRVATPRVAMLRLIGALGDDVDPETAYWQGIVRNDRRNTMIVSAIQRCAERKLPVLVLVVRIEHGHRLEDMLRRAGMEVPFVHGKTPLQVIEQAKRDLDASHIPAVCASTIFDYGQDLPAIRALINAGGQRSPLVTIQRAGRALRRKWTGENAVDILDFVDECHRTLASQSRARRKTYERKRMQFRAITSLDEWLV